ncbi:MAG: LexA family protein [Armatimonadota bacterium]
MYSEARQQRKALFAQRLKAARQRTGLSQSGLATRLETGITRSGVAKWEVASETAEPEYEMLIRLAALLGVTVPYLLGLTERMDPERTIANLIPVEAMRQVPVLGTIAAGQPLLAVEEVGETIALPADMLPAGDVFALRVRGDSMIEEQIYDGDLALIEHMPVVPDRTIAAVLVEDEATLKTVRFFDDHVVLMPANPAHRPMMYRPDEVRILGKLRMVVQQRG